MIRHIFLVLVLFSCSQSNNGQSINKRVELAEFKTLIKDANVQLVDIRTPQEYKGGFIDDAINIDFMAESFLTNCSAQLDKTKPVAIYCASGGRSAKALVKLKEEGFQEVYELGVGYSGYH
jgi:rhodanese-related sulfurtransferase